ncbi:hypothetical protein RJ640_018295 [Escallonia rubra]|uniref:J domain-containing protein n=1 Tax=Escallonia rubra TaxID=112253 RepID=A0AA88RYE6_9ASTE|nr:hypothetical protein RJ640_018295 [Escallonia rubra]
MALLGKRCQYKVLGLGGDCTADEIRSAYRRLALQHHPDKFAQFSISPAAFQELAAAYKVFSDPRERTPRLPSTPSSSPTFSVANGTVDFTFLQYVTVSNPNRDAFTHYDSSLQLAYSGTPVGFIFILQ